MTEGNFVDYVKMHVTSGKGGGGSAHLRREKFVTKGGPDGGDGGRGGHIIARTNPNMWTLLHLKFKRHLRAEHGENGGKQTSTGADGADVYVDVPLGTVIRDSETQEILKELTEEGQEYIIAEGGMGGRGNSHFKSSTNQTPRYAQPGIEGQEVDVQYREFQTFVVADIPGIIEGAAEGKGLGYRFLRHIERNSTLLFMIPADAADIAEQYRILLNELEKYNPEMLDKDRLIAISKSDMLDSELKAELKKELDKSLPIPYLFISSVAQQGLTELKDTLWQMLNTNDDTSN